MPPAVRFTKEAVLNAAYELVRREGPAALNARAVARELGGSTQPIFRLFSSMDELYGEVIRLTDETICDKIRQRAASSTSPYLSVCMSYLLFARDEPQLFKLLFMRDRSSDATWGREYSHEWGFRVIETTFGVDRETARELYDRSFFYVHGLAVCIATKYLPCMSEERMAFLVSESLRSAAAQMGIALYNI